MLFSLSRKDEMKKMMIKDAEDSTREKLGDNEGNKLFQVAGLDFYGECLPSLSINYFGMSKDMGKRLSQLYYIKMKTSYDLGFIAIGVAVERNDAITFFIYLCVSLLQEFFDEIA